MIRVAMVAPYRERCGIADYVRNLSRVLSEDIQICQAVIPEMHTSRRAWSELVILTNQADLAHVHFEYGLFDPVKPYRNRYADFMRKLRVPSLVTLHGSFPALQPRWRRVSDYGLCDLIRDIVYAPFFRTWEARQYRWASHFMVHSQELMHRVEMFVEQGQVTFMQMPVPALSVRWEWTQERELCLITPGFIKPLKGYEDLLEMVAGKNTWRWILAGGAQDQHDAAYVDDLKYRIHHLHLEDRINMTGYLSSQEMEALLAQAAIAVFPFRQSLGSASIAWAVAMGMPVVATDLPAVRDMKEAGAGIELLSKDNQASWASQIEQLLHDRKRLIGLAEMNQQYAQTFSYARTAEKVAEIYRCLDVKSNMDQAETR